MGKHDIRNILIGGGILAVLYFLFRGKIPEWPPANGGNGGNGTIPPTVEPIDPSTIPGYVTQFEYDGVYFTSFDEWHNFLHTQGYEPIQVYSQTYRDFQIQGIGIYRPYGGSPGPLLYWRIWGPMPNSPTDRIVHQQFNLYLYKEASALTAIDYIHDYYGV